MARVKPLQLSDQIKWQQESTTLTCDRSYDANFKYCPGGAGLAMEKSVDSRLFRIRNFATHQVLDLPRLPKGSSEMRLVFDLSTGECKVGGFHKKEEVYTIGLGVCIKILSVGNDDHWSTLGLPYKNNGEILMLSRYSIRSLEALEEGAAQVVQLIKDGEDLIRVQVQSLDLCSKCFTIAKLPKEAFLDLTRVEIIYWNNHVAVADIIEEDVNVWVLENFKEPKLRNIIAPLTFLKDNPSLKDHIRLYYARSDVLYLHNVVEDTIVKNGVKRGRVNEVIKRKDIEKRNFDFRKPSLVTIKGMKNED